MKTWLFTWNPNLWSWDDKLTGLNEMKNEIEQIGFTISKWTCGINKSIKTGDRIFLIRLGKNPKGIVASGYALSNVFEGCHWNSEHQKNNKRARRIFIKFDKILDADSEKIIDIVDLINLDENYHWSSQASGVSIPEELQLKIEIRWKDLK